MIIIYGKLALLAGLTGPTFSTGKPKNNWPQNIQKLLDFLQLCSQDKDHICTSDSHLFYVSLESRLTHMLDQNDGGLKVLNKLFDWEQSTCNNQPISQVDSASSSVSAPSGKKTPDSHFASTIYYGCWPRACFHQSNLLSRSFLTTVFK